jgi:hypothetical protein
MNPRVGGGPNELAHDEWSVGENEQTEETENQSCEKSITQVTYFIKPGRPLDINRTRPSEFLIFEVLIEEQLTTHDAGRQTRYAHDLKGAEGRTL